MVSDERKHFINDKLNNNLKNQSLDFPSLNSIVTIKSYTYTNLVLGYGPNHEVTVNVFWCTESKEFKLVFTGFGSSVNSHSIMAQQLQAHLNYSHNLTQFVYTLHETYDALTALVRLPIIPHLGIPVSQTQPY